MEKAEKLYLLSGDSSESKQIMIGSVEVLHSGGLSYTNGGKARRRDINIPIHLSKTAHPSETPDDVPPDLIAKATVASSPTSALRLFEFPA